MKRARNSVAAVVLATGAWACDPGPVGPYPDAPVVLVSIDTLRADRLPLYGYAAGSTPVLDTLGREGIVFEDAYTHCPLTLPAHASLFTGLLPPRHGVRDNMGFTLDSRHATLASRFQAAGLATGGAVSAYVLRAQTGIARGFDFYDDALEIEGRLENLGAVQRDGAQAVDALARWIDDHAGERFFAFLHLYEPHTPYTPPESYRHFSQPYDGEIAYADALLGRFLKRLRAHDLLERAVVAITSDHGEGLNEHNEAEHGIFLYREAVRVPLILRLPGGARGGTRVQGTVGLTDVAATLLDLAGLSSEGLQGTSLRGALEAGATEPRRVYSETLFPRYHFGWSELHAVTEGRQRYIRAPRPELFDVATDPGERRNLFRERGPALAGLDRWIDERSSEGAGDAPQQVAGEVAEKLEALGYVGMATDTASSSGSRELPDPKDKIGSYEDLKRALSLRKQGRETEAIPVLRAVLADNPRMLDAWEVLAKTLLELGRAEEAIEAFTSALRIDPTRSPTHTGLVRAYVATGRRDLALSHAELAAAGDPGSGYEVLAQLMLDEKRLDLAAEFAGQSLAADPQRALSHYILGVAAQDAGRYAEGLEHYRRAQAVKSRRKHAILRGLHAGMAMCLAYLGREDEAEREFLAELEAVPYSREGRQGLATLYWSQGRDGEARKVLSGLIDALPQPTADAYWTVVHTFSVLGDGRSVREWAHRARQRFPSDPRFRSPPS